ncbi:ABC transporter permease [archaeon]|nr:ABC transporter permease [archaeon]
MSFLKKFLKRDKKKPKVEKEKKEEKQELNVFVGRPRLNVITKLYYIMAKNFKLILRSKISALLLLLGPLLIVFLLALAFNTSTLYDLNVAVYSESYSSISEDIVSNLSTSQYNVLRMDSETDCIDAIKFDDFQVCVIFPTNMILDNSANNVITIYVDNSRMNIAHLISAEISSKVYI